MIIILAVYYIHPQFYPDNRAAFPNFNNNSLDTEAACLDLHLSITNGIDSSKICDKQDVFNKLF